MNLKTIPRNLINLNLKAARLPWNALERATTRNEMGSPVSIALDNAEATVKETLGGLLNDQQLLSDARLQRAKVAKLQEAVVQKAAAEQHEAVAEQRLDSQLRSVEENKAKLEREAREREQQLAAEKAQAKRRVAEAATQQKKAAAKAAAQRQERLDEKQRMLDLRRLEAEAQAVAEKDRALAAEERAIKLDAEAKATKRLRTAK